MKFWDEQGNEVVLKKSKTLPGYEVILSEDVVIDSPVDNPFFKGINILQLPKKMKGFRNNSDLGKILQPQKVNIKIRAKLRNNEFVIFKAEKQIIDSLHLILVDNTFGDGEYIQPMFINFGIKKVVLEAGSIIGTLIIQEAII